MGHPINTVRAGLASIVLIMGATAGIEYCHVACTNYKLHLTNGSASPAERYLQNGPSINEFTRAFAEKYHIPFLDELVK